MDINRKEINQLIRYRSESLNVEIKGWIDPADDLGIAKIARAALALRNRNGGYLIIGFDDVTRAPDEQNAPPDVRAAFHIDVIQSIVSKYAAEPFEIAVEFETLNGREYPVIVIPAGVRTVVAAKADLFDSTKGRKLISFGDVYFRSLSSNGTPSTGIARPHDWAEIIDICADNREADLGRLLRRYLGPQDIARFASALAQIGLSHSSPPPPPSLRDRAINLLDDGERNFATAIAERPVTNKKLLSAGTWSVGLVLDPEREAGNPNQVFLATVGASNPNLTGWPVWLDSRTFMDRRSAPYVRAKAWEALIISDAQDWWPHLDFYRMAPQGEFYLRRVLEDDVAPDISSHSVIDPYIVLLRVAEAIAVGLSFAAALEWNPQETHLGFAFRWRGLKGRVLNNWGSPTRMFVRGGGKAFEDEVTTFVDVPLDTPLSAIPPFVEQCTRDLFALFDGFTVPREVIEQTCKRLIERRL